MVTSRYAVQGMLKKFLQEEEYFELNENENMTYQNLCDTA